MIFARKSIGYSLLLDILSFDLRIACSRWNYSSFAFHFSKDSTLGS